MGNKDRYWALRSNGRCVTCGEPAGGKSRCAYCAKKLSEACKESQRKKRQGLQSRIRELEAEVAELRAYKQAMEGK